MAPIRVVVRQTKELYAENVQYLSSSAFTFEFERGFCAGQLPLDFEQGCFTIITKGDRNLEWQNAECGDDRWHELFRLPYFTCHCIGPGNSWTMTQIIDQGLLTWEDGGRSGPFLTVIRTRDFNAILSRELNGRTLRSMVAWLRSLLPEFLRGTDEPVKEFVPSLAKDDGFIPEYSKYISSPRATTDAPRRRNVITSRSSGPPTVTRHNFIRSCCSTADPPIVARRVTGPPADTRRVTGPPTVTQRGRNRVMSDNSLLPPAYTPVSTQRTIYAVPGQTINIVTSSTTGLIINPYVHAN